MTTDQTVINHRALIAAAAKLERTGWAGDSFRFVEGLVLSVLADGFRPLDKPIPTNGPGARRQSIDECKAAAVRAVQAAKERRTAKGAGR